MQQLIENIFPVDSEWLHTNGQSVCLDKDILLRVKSWGINCQFSYVIFECREVGTKYDLGMMYPHVTFKATELLEKLTNNQLTRIKVE